MAPKPKPGLYKPNPMKGNLASATKIGPATKVPAAGATKIGPATKVPAAAAEAAAVLGSKKPPKAPAAPLWNPSKGVNSMAYQEWVDRHPALSGASEKALKEGHAYSQSEQGGKEFAEKNGGVEAVAKMDPAPPKQHVQEKPESPRPGGKPVGGTWQQFKESHSGTKDDAYLAAVWRKANGMKLNDKMREAAMRRHAAVAGKKPGGDFPDKDAVGAIIGGRKPPRGDGDNEIVKLPYKPPKEGKGGDRFGQLLGDAALELKSQKKKYGRV